MTNCQIRTASLIGLAVLWFIQTRLELFPQEVQLFSRLSGIRIMKKETPLYLLLSLLFVVLTTAGCGEGAHERSAKRMPEGCAESSLVHDGLTRWYRICLPDKLPEQAPLVLYLHGGTLSMRSLFSPLADSSATWFSLAEEHGIVLLVPNGVNPETGETYGDDQVWNDLRPDQASGQSQADDVGFLSALLDRVIAEYPIDPERIFITGASNGGMMTYRMLVETPEHFRAGAAFIANLPDIGVPFPQPPAPVPIMIANGTEDPLMPYDGGSVAKDRGVVISTRQTVDWWVQANHADPNQMDSRTLPDIDASDKCLIHEEFYPPGEDGAAVMFYRVEGGGHTLPSRESTGLFTRLMSRLLGPVCRDADGPSLVWEFFSEVSEGSIPD